MKSMRSFSLMIALTLMACEPLFDARMTESSSATVNAALSQGRGSADSEQPTKAERRRGSDDGPVVNAKRERPRRVRENIREAAREEAREEASEGEESEEGLNASPARYSVKLTTTKGEVVIDVTRAWAPRGADRFHELVQKGYSHDCAFFRVLDGFMAQTGVNGDPAVSSQWQTKRIQDDPVEQSNRRGYVSFAMAGPNSRTTQFFINYSDNRRLDSMGFAPFGQVRDMTAVDALYSGYGEGAPRGRGPSQGRLQSEGNTYLRAEFPQLDYIRTAELIGR
jgi:peptidyl-prolyl cis-trans isomerase A (cyclophilin A)